MHDVDEIPRIDRLLEVVSHSKSKGGGADPLRAVAREHDHGEARASRPEFSQYFEPGAVWEAMVQDNQVNRFPAHFPEGFRARRRATDLVPLTQENSEKFLKGSVVIHHEDPLARPS